MTSSEKKRLNDWLQRQNTFPECLSPRQIPSLRQHKAEQIESSQLCLVGNKEFVAWHTGLHFEDTGEPMARVWGWEAGPEALPKLLQTSKNELPHTHLVFVRTPKGPPAPELLTDQGFRLQRHLLTLNPTLHDLSESRYEEFQMREAVELDRSLLTSLAANSVGFTLPPGAGHELEKYTQSVMDRYGRLRFEHNSPYTLLIAEHRRTRQGLGYILLLEDEDGMVMLDDMAVKREYWGKYVGHFMVRSVENLLVENDYSLLYAEISEANKRSLLTAIRQVRFQRRLEYWQSEGLTAR